MKPIEFKEMTCILAKDQPQYLPLPVHIDKDGIVTSCWKLSLKERIKMLFSSKIWISVMTFNKPLQPQLIHVNNPFVKDKKQ